MPEVLIAIALLGVLAAFTIPKILQFSQNEQKKSLFRETIAVLFQVQQQGMLEGQLSPSVLPDYFASHVNTVKFCPANSAVEGCWNQAIQGVDAFSQDIQPGFILANGVVVSGFARNLPASDLAVQRYYNGIVIDWNGIGNPNTIGDDQLWLLMCYGAVSCASGTMQPGQIITPDATMVPATQVLKNQALYSWINN